MGQVTVTLSLNGRSYRLRCDEHDEARLHSLAAYLEDRIERLAAQSGQAGDDRLTVMAALLIADELFEARERNGSEDTDQLDELANDDADAVPSAPPPVANDRGGDSELQQASNAQSMLKRALRKSQAKASRSPLSLEQRLAAARVGSNIELKTTDD